MVAPYHERQPGSVGAPPRKPPTPEEISKKEAELGYVGVLPEVSTTDSQIRRVIEAVTGNAAKGMEREERVIQHGRPDEKKPTAA